MSKREFKKYIGGLTKAQLQEQITDLYERFKPVKEYYDFAFNPNEAKRLEECKFKISKEYFPINSRRPKLRRSVAQKYIKHFAVLGVEPAIIADVMLYNIEVAQAFCADNRVNRDAFYISMLKSFQEAMNYIINNGLQNSTKPRLQKIVENTLEQNWFNYKGFESAMETAL